MLHIATTDGQPVRLRQTVLTARTGDHAGRSFRIDEILHEHGRHFVRASRRFGRHNGRHTIKVLPEIFDLVITEIEEIMQELQNVIVRWWKKFDEGLYVGTLALIPLAYFEHYDLSDKIVEFVHTMIDNPVALIMALGSAVGLAALIAGLAGLLARRKH